jgi:hypothetical protein
MRVVRLSESCLHRVVVVAAATTLVMMALVTVKSDYFGIDNSNTIGRVDVNQANRKQAAEIERTAFVSSPTIDTNPKFFFGTGDGSNGYYAERPGSR